MAFHYQIELRNTDGELLEILQSEITSINWRYDSIGGCGDCEIVLNRPFDDFGDIEIDYDVQIWRVENAYGSPGTPFPLQLPFKLGQAYSSTIENRWTGFIREIGPMLEEKETVALRCSGYIRQLQYLIVPAQSYASMDVGAAARSIIDTYVLPGSKIKRTTGLSLVQDTGLSISSTGLTFDCSVYEAMQTLAEIGANAEWGVRADKEIYFLPRSTTVKQTHQIGDRIRRYESSQSADDLVNWVYLRGASGFTATLEFGSYQTGYQKERVVFVPSIANSNDATLWGVAYFARFGALQPKARLTIGASEAWIENVSGQTMPPLGRLRVYGAPTTVFQGASFPLQLPFQLGTNLVGSTDTSYRINSIQYQPTETGLDISVDLGEKRGTLADLMRGIEFKLSELRQGL